ncbi:DUF2169 family type VI secretion system accessory protein [Serratia silvae]|uniref:DUF2169 domain-containing protein n=1 Tax=Serratia silvae TaxID=2824122 RepID=A0ABT0KB46_9GAMM|nr:DUF2169 domain-containing protein [Serratia silvae]MCL1029176.1 DUF2169 domain-containing protein [Serratia silvae]
MFFNNTTPYSVDWSPGFDKNGREQLVVIIKVTWELPHSGQDLVLADMQTPLIEADISTGKPGFSATLYEGDYATFKPCCDVLVNGCAYSPSDRPVKEVPVLLQVNNQNNTLLSKGFMVKGDRYWEPGVISFRPSSQQPFTKMPVSYDNAFGGIDNTKLTHPYFYQDNPVGRGYSHHKTKLAGTLLANTEEIGNPIRTPGGHYRPMALGAVGRSWPIRSRYAGTYDDHWIQNIMPFCPDDFDYRFFQSTPPDQQIPYPQGGEIVSLLNFSQNAVLKFKLPQQKIPVIFIPHVGSDKQLQSMVDTILIEPELGRVVMTSRAVLPIKKSLHEIKEVIVGEMSSSWYRIRYSPHKKHYSSLLELCNKI